MLSSCHQVLSQALPTSPPYTQLYMYLQIGGHVWDLVWIRPSCLLTLFVCQQAVLMLVMLLMCQVCGFLVTNHSFKYLKLELGFSVVFCCPVSTPPWYDALSISCCFPSASAGQYSWLTRGQCQSEDRKVREERIHDQKSRCVAYVLLLFRSRGYEFH